MESNGRYAMVTGASSGIGKQYARALAAKGYHVLVVSNRSEDNRRVAAEISAMYGVVAEPIDADLTKSDAADCLYAWCEQRSIEVEVLISNAGCLLFSQLIHTPSEKIDNVMALHCTTPAKLCRLFGSAMRERGHGYILLMSSMTAWLPYPTLSIYGASKAFLKNFGTSLWYEMQGSGVSVTTVFPGSVDTPLYQLDERRRRMLRRFGIMMSAEQLARKGLRAMFHRRRRCVPGFFTKISLGLCRILPAHALLLVMKIPAIRRILEHA